MDRWRYFYVCSIMPLSEFCAPFACKIAQWHLCSSSLERCINLVRSVDRILMRSKTHQSLKHRSLSTEPELPMHRRLVYLREAMRLAKKFPRDPPVGALRVEPAWHVLVAREVEDPEQLGRRARVGDRASLSRRIARWCRWLPRHGEPRPRPSPPHRPSRLRSADTRPVNSATAMFRYGGTVSPRRSKRRPRNTAPCPASTPSNPATSCSSSME
jgi:hypothetical protein